MKGPQNAHPLTESRRYSEVMKILLGVVAERNATLVVVTHDTSLAAHGDRTLIIRDGKVAKD